MEWVKIEKVANVPKGKMKLVKKKGIPITVANVDEKFYAFYDRCPHMNYSLSKGTLKGKVVTCPLHYATFDVTTGKKLSEPEQRLPPELKAKLPKEFLQMMETSMKEVETLNLITIEVKVEKDSIFVKI